MKSDWFALNGGAGSSTIAGAGRIGQVKKPPFYDVAFNYIELPMDRLVARSSKAPPPASIQQKAQAPIKAPAAAAKPTVPAQTPPATTKRERRATKVEEAPAAPEIKVTETGGWGVGGILGGWWGRK